MRPVTKLKRRLADESGVLLIVAMFVLLIIGVLVATAITVSSQTSTSTTRDSNTKAALEAAEAGLQVAAFRLTRRAPPDAECITGTEVATAETSGENAGYCAGPSGEPLGNGATYQYWTSKALASGEKCAGATVGTPEVPERCITAEGKVTGLNAGTRLQTLVSAVPLFPVNGIFGEKEVIINNNVKAKTGVGTDGNLEVKNGAEVESVTLGPEGTLTGGGGVGTVTHDPSPMKLTSVPFGKTAEMAVNGNCETEVGKNCDLRIVNGLKSPVVAPSDESSGIEFNQATRELSVKKGSITLGGGVYNFCDFTTQTNAEIKLLSGVKTEIYIDDAEDPASKCPALSGKFLMNNNSTFVTPTKDATMLKIYVYGSEGGNVEFSNNLTFYGEVYAPHSTIWVKNNAEIVGAFAGQVVDVKNNAPFTSVTGPGHPTTGDYERKTWEQCTPGAGAKAGC